MTVITAWTDASILQTQRSNKTLVTLACCGMIDSAPWYEVHVWRRAPAREPSLVYEAHAVLLALRYLQPWFNEDHTITLRTELMHTGFELDPGQHGGFKIALHPLLTRITTLAGLGGVQLASIEGSTNPAHALAHNLVRAKGRPYMKDERVYRQWEPGAIHLQDELTVEELYTTTTTN